MPKNHTDKERFAAASSCIEKRILTLLFPRKRRRSSPSPFISHRVLEAVASRILKSLIIVNVYAPAIAKCLQENLSTSDLQPVSNKQMSNAYGGIGFSKEEAKIFAQLLLHWDHGMNNGRPIKIPFLRRYKFPLGCDGHVSKFPIQSLYYPW